MDFYDFADTIKTVYNRIQDDLSRNIFWARLQFDIEPTMSHAIQLLRFAEGYSEHEISSLKSWKDVFQKKSWPDEERKILLYGAGAFGQLAADLIWRDGEDFFAFCDKRAETADTKLYVDGKRVYPPSYLFEHADHCYVLIATTEHFLEIEQSLLERGFPQDHILPFRFERIDGPDTSLTAKQYFAFPELFQPGTSFIDAGCFDGTDSITFAQWCGGHYERILAFEPDRKNCDICRTRMAEAGLQRFEVIPCGLSNCESTVRFSAGLNASSYILNENYQRGALAVPLNSCDGIETIQTAALDDYAQDITVGFVKMDIEGSEMVALHGARKTIQRDKPFLALSVYHRRGDILAILECLHSFVPEYRFWLRHYGPLAHETVLYAAV